MYIIVLKLKHEKSHTGDMTVDDTREIKGPGQYGCQDLAIVLSSFQPLVLPSRRLSQGLLLTLQDKQKRPTPV